MREYHSEFQRYIGPIRVYGNRGEDTVKGFGELLPCLVHTEREEQRIPCDDLAVYFRHCYRGMRRKMFQNLSDGAATERSGACNVAGSMSSGKSQSIVLCRRCDYCFGGCCDLRAAFAAEVFGPFFGCG